MATLNALGFTALFALAGFGIAYQVDVRVAGVVAIVMLLAATASAQYQPQPNDYVALALGFAGGVGIFVMTHLDLLGIITT